MVSACVYGTYTKYSFCSNIYFHRHILNGAYQQPCESVYEYTDKDPCTQRLFDKAIETADDFFLTRKAWETISSDSVTMAACKALLPIVLCKLFFYHFRSILSCYYRLVQSGHTGDRPIVDRFEYGMDDLFFPPS